MSWKLWLGADLPLLYGVALFYLCGRLGLGERSASGDMRDLMWSPIYLVHLRVFGGTKFLLLGGPLSLFGEEELSGWFLRL